LLIVGGIVAVGYGFTGVDFAIAHDLWSPTGDRTTNFPLLGKLDTVTAFQISFVTVGVGFVLFLIGSHFAIANSSTIRHAAYMAVGAALFAWAIWGIAFSFDTVTFRMLVDVDAVDIPCPDLGGELGPVCRFTSTEWLFINFAMAAIGFVVALVGARKTRVVRVAY